MEVWNAVEEPEEVLSRYKNAGPLGPLATLGRVRQAMTRIWPGRQERLRRQLAQLHGDCEVLREKILQKRS